MHRRLLPIVSPCHEDWEQMAGDVARRCERCRTSVVDLSALSERQARAVLATPGEMCIRYRSDEAGRVRFRRRPSRALELAALVSLLTVAQVKASHADSENAIVGKNESPPKKKPPKPIPPPPKQDDLIMGKRSAD